MRAHLLPLVGAFQPHHSPTLLRAFSTTGETTWDKPAGKIVEAESGAATAASVGQPVIIGNEEVGRTGWNEVRMSDGTSYFFHQATHRTTWDVPPEVAQSKLRAAAAAAATGGGPDKHRPARPEVEIPPARKGGAEPPPPGLSPRPEAPSTKQEDTAAGSVGAADRTLCTRPDRLRGIFETTGLASWRIERALAGHRRDWS